VKRALLDFSAISAKCWGGESGILEMTEVEMTAEGTDLACCLMENKFVHIMKDISTGTWIPSTHSQVASEIDFNLERL